MNDDKLAERQGHHSAKRAVQKPHVERDVTERMIGRARTGPLLADRGRGSAVATDTRSLPTGEIMHFGLDVQRGWNVLGRMEAIDYLFSVAYLLMGARLVLALLGVDPANGIVRLMNALTNPLYAPFRGVVAIPTTEAGHTLALPILIALVGYILAHAAISGLVRVARERQPLV